MGRLSGQVVYLSGAIDRCPNLGVAWRESLQEVLIKDYGVIPFNPMNKPVVIAGEHEFREQRRDWKRNGHFTKLKEFVKQIRHVDLRMCDKSDFGIFYIDIDIHACGTYEELTRMNISKKPCLVVCAQGLQQMPDWLFATLPVEHLFDTWEDMLKYLDEVHTGEAFDDMGRWVFWNYSLIKGLLLSGN